MHQDRNLQILELLANGINPFNNEALPSDNPCQHPDVIRALFNAITIIKKTTRQRVTPKPAKKGVPWTMEEDEQLIAGYKNNSSLEQLAKQHERSRTAIETRLIKLGLIQPKHFHSTLYTNNVGASV